MRALVLVLALAGCTKKPPPRVCFDVTSATTSDSTRQVFDRRGCQGGGVTWAGVLRVLVRREGEPRPASEKGWTGDVRTLNGALLSIDDEGDAARFCSDQPAFLERLRAEVARLNADPALLEKAMAETTPLELECDEDEQVERAVQVQRLEDALKAERTWCWPAQSITRASGKLTFEPDAGLTHLAVDGGTTLGRWRFENDGRIEAVLPRALHHFDVEASGRLSTHFIDGLRADGSARIVIEELVPCR